jgi:uncharacterized protein involved in type VI secretion and phage assembly
MKRWPGVVVGVVKSLEDPRGEGRILLEYPWLEPGERSGWAPVAAPLAGKQRGAFFMPEIDDEVLVAFDRGDFNHPFIVGFLWNGVDKPPETDAKNRVIVTPGGHQLRFEDADGGKRVVLKTAGGHTLLLEDDGGNQISIKTRGGQQSITLSDTQSSIEIRGGQRSITLQGGIVRIQ